MEMVAEQDEELMEKYLEEGELDALNRMFFTFASYNAGPARVVKLRREAKEMGLDPNVWFDNVEFAMLELSKAEYAKQARHGYVRGREPVEYVRKIRERYRAYVDLLEIVFRSVIPIVRHVPRVPVVGDD